MKIPVKPVLKIEDGAHRGVITGVLYRTAPYEYTDIVIKIDNDKGIIKASFPTMITNESKLGQLLTAFGAVLEVGKDIDPEEILKGRNVSFMTMKNTTERGTFANVVNGSVKPA